MDSILAYYNSEEGFEVPQYILQAAYYVYMDCNQENKAKYILFNLAQGQIDNDCISLIVLKLVLKQIPKDHPKRGHLLLIINDGIEASIKKMQGELHDLEVS